MNIEDINLTDVQTSTDALDQSIALNRITLSLLKEQKESNKRMFGIILALIAAIVIMFGSFLYYESQKYTRMDVSSQVRTQSIQTALKKYQDWEEGSLELYGKCSTLLGVMNCDADKRDIDNLISDVDEELKHLYEIILAFKSVNYDVTFVMEYQKNLK